MLNTLERVRDEGSFSRIMKRANPTTSNEAMKEICALQRSIVAAASRYVKPGGILVYSTCTVHKAENEKVVRYILDELPFEGDSLRPVIPGLFANSAERQNDFAVQLRPDRDGTDGFFISRFKRIG